MSAQPESPRGEDQEGVTVPATGAKKGSFSTVFEGTPGKAALYSLIVPGAGQIYNKRYWKAPLVWAAEGVAAYFLIDRIQTYNKWNTCYQSLVNGTGDPVCGNINSVSDAFQFRNSARSNKELAWVAMGVVHLLNVLEAFIDRHLINFDTSEDLGYLDFGIHTEPAFMVPSFDVVRIRIPLNRPRSKKY